MTTSYSFEAIGTHWTIDIIDDLDQDKKIQLDQLIHDRIDQFDKTYSRFRKDSLVTQMSQRAGIYELPADIQPMISLYQELYKLTDGLMTPLVGNLLSDIGYDAVYSLQKKSEIKPVPTWAESFDYQYPTITIKQPVMFDFGACGKGYLIDLVGELLQKNGVYNYCIDAGGDMLQKNTTNDSLRVALEDPEHIEQAIGVIEINNQAVAGSAGNRRAWGTFHHIINPKTQTSPKNILAIWVVAKTCMLADGLATALTFCPANILSNQFAFDYLILYADRSVEGNLMNKITTELF